MSQFEDSVRASIQEIGEDTFPDNAVAWKLSAIEEKGGYAYAEAVADPAEVGYPQFRFVLRPDKSGKPEFVACLVWEDGKWIQLCSAPGAPRDWKSFA